MNEKLNQTLIDAGLAYADCFNDINTSRIGKHPPILIKHIKNLNGLFLQAHPDNLFDYDLGEHSQAVFELGYRLYRMLDYIVTKT